MCMASSGKCAIFGASPSVNTKTEMLDIKTGNTIGQVMSQQNLIATSSSFDNLYGLNDAGTGNSGFYLESAQGVLKGWFPPSVPNLYGSADYVRCSIPISQNDTLSIMWGS